MDIDPEEIGRNCEVAIGIVADAKRGLAQLLAQVPRYNRKRISRREELTAVKQRTIDRLRTLQPQASYAQAIREAMPDDGIVVNERTQVGYWMNYGFQSTIRGPSSRLGIREHWATASRRPWAPRLAIQPKGLSRSMETEALCTMRRSYLQ